MKNLLATAALAAALLPARAQLVGPESATAALLGGRASGISGHKSGGHAGEGVAIGAGPALLVGSLADDHEWHPARTQAGRPAVVDESPPAPPSAPPPAAAVAVALAVPDAPRAPDAPTFGVTPPPCLPTGPPAPVARPPAQHVTLTHNCFSGPGRVVKTTDVVARP